MYIRRKECAFFANFRGMPSMRTRPVAVYRCPRAKGSVQQLHAARREGEGFALNSFEAVLQNVPRKGEEAG